MKLLTRFKRFLRQKTTLIFFILIIVCILISFIQKNKFNNIKSYTTDDNFIVHYIDVSQGDCILVQVNGFNMLIDSGPKASKNLVNYYLDKNNIKTLDYVIGTHPHEDHIGNMAWIIQKYNVKKFFAPKITSDAKYFEDMLHSLNKKHLKINEMKSGTESIDLGPDTKVYIYAPVNNSYDEINDFSAVIKICYKNTSFLFCGDAECLSENEIIDKGYDLKSDILKVGHHGSKTSTSDNFLNKVDPKAAIISVGNDNDYNHPDKEVLERLTQNNTKIYRTDKDGSVVLSSDGTTIIKH